LVHDRYIGIRAGNPPIFSEQVGLPTEPGKASKVTLSQSYVMSIFIEAANAGDRDSVPSEYPATGEADADADYSEIQANFSTECHADLGEAFDSLALAVAPVRAELALFDETHGTEEQSETDRFETQQAAPPSTHFPYDAAEWDTTQRAPNNPDRFLVTKFRSRCDGTLVDAPPSGSRFDLAPKWRTSQTLVLKSHKFDELLDRAKDLQRTHGVSPQLANAGTLHVTNPVAGVTTKTQQALDVAARADAVDQVLADDGLFAAAADRHDFAKAFFRNLVPAGFFFRGGFGGANAPALSSLSESESASTSKDSTEVEIVLKKGDDRPAIRMTRHYRVTYEVASKDYAALYKVGREARGRERQARAERR